jgi:hypothetical protein
VLCLWISASGIGNGFWINGSYSDDDGDTWVNFVTQAAGTGVDGLTDPNHFSVCYHGGYLTAVITADNGWTLRFFRPGRYLDGGRHHRRWRFWLLR